MEQPERTWREGLHPRPMLECLPERPSDRKLRLFALACCRHCGHLLSDPRSVAALEFVERYAEVGPERRRGRPAALSAAQAAWMAAFGETYRTDGPARSAAMAAACAAGAACSLLRYAPWVSAYQVPEYAANALAFARLAGAGEAPPRNYGPVDTRPGQEQQARLLRDILGDPFAPAPALGPVARDATVSRIARGIDEEGAYDRLAVLADALEDAGCADEATLAHCRGPGPHVRGCWVIDLLLGRA